MSEAISYAHPRDQILGAIERIYRYRMTTTSGGNISIREPDGSIWITPARVDKGTLRREDIVLVRPDGSSEGLHPPSSELPFHQEVYRARPELTGIVHAHPVALVAFSLVGKTPDTRLFHQAMHVCGKPGFAPYELPGSLALGRNVAGIFAKGHDCVILENHGVVTGGAGLPEAFYRFETLEFAGKVTIKAGLLGEIRHLGEEQIGLSQQRGSALPEFAREAPSSAEKELRLRLCEFVRRAYRQRLFISTQGSFSARLDEQSFVITPYRVDRGIVEPRDLVLIREGRAEAGKQPSRAANLHQAIYEQQGSTGAVINAYPVNATAFSVTDHALDTRTIPESYVVLRQVGRIPYGVQFQRPEEAARQLGPGQPTALVENDGVLAVGGDILEAFDRLEVLESTAEALINSRAVGTLSPMSEGNILELERKFFGTRAV